MSEAVFHNMKFENISLNFDETNVFSDVSFEFPLDEIVTISGVVGSGKSSLLKILIGLTQATKGEFFINGQDVNEMSFEEFLPYRLKIGYSFDFGGLISNKTIYDNLALPLQYHGKHDPDEIKKKVDELLDLFEIKESSDLRPSAASGSTRKAAIVARAFVMEPEMLLLDNPSVGLGKEIKEMIKQLIVLRMGEGSLKHVFIASDDQDFLMGLTTRSIEIGNKKILAWDTLPEKNKKVFKI